MRGVAFAIAPPLSDEPERFTGRLRSIVQAPVYSVGGGVFSPALSSVFVALRSLVPERFRGGCAFGGGSS